MFELINTKEDKNNMIELPDGYECVFEKNFDSLVSGVESLIKDLSVRIKPGFRDTAGKGKSKLFNGLIVEFEQSVKDRKNEEEEKLINIKGEIKDIINFLEVIKAEMEKLSNEGKVKLEKKPIWSTEGVVNVGRGRITTLHLPIIVRTKKGDITAMSYADIKEVVDCVKEFDY